MNFVKTLTSKPVIGVGRFTSPETMVSLIENGVMDMLGAARPSIADPFLPQKIKDGRIEDIRGCIGCNICVPSDFLFMPIRSTQNPTMGEEWKRGWHPEKIQPKKTNKEILVVGGGPAGIECARALGERGYEVILTEARNELGGRVLLESALPNLIEWRRVIDYRLTQIEKMPNVTVYPSSEMGAQDGLETGIKDVIIATGVIWRRDGIGRSHFRPIPGVSAPHVYTPNDTLYLALKPHLANGDLNSLRNIGDADAPNIIERAVFAGHLAAREFDEAPQEGTPFLIERFVY